MTKRTAIQAAMERLRTEAEARSVRDGNYCVVYEGSPLPGSVEAEIDRSYELGRIAGLREAARDMERGYDDPEADKTALAVNEALDELALQLRSRANRLAKNVRTK